jgi:hypothetical protein
MQNKDGPYPDVRNTPKHPDVTTYPWKRKT